MHLPPPIAAKDALAALWRDLDLPSHALAHADLPAEGPVVASSFCVATAAQASLAAAALCAGELWKLRTGSDERQRIRVSAAHAVLESSAHFRIDGRAPNVWDKLSGLYPCGSGPSAGWVRIHANFEHHRDGALRLLGCPPGPATQRQAVVEALRNWRADDFEAAAADAGLVVAAARSFSEWDAMDHARALRRQPLVSITRIEGAQGFTNPARPPAIDRDARPLTGLRALDLTRILAGPVAGRTLAAYGMDVMLINSPHLPNIEAIADTSRGKLSAHVDLKCEAGRSSLRELIAGADVFLQGYRPGALGDLGFGPVEVARIKPGIVYVSLSAYGSEGPWAARRGFDSLVQTATGFNVEEAAALGDAQPKAMPIQVLDYCAGYLLAFGAQAALLKQAREGGSWHVQVSLAGVGLWLRTLGRIPQDAAPIGPLPIEPYLETSDSGFGELTAVRHAAHFSRTPAGWARPSVPPGTHPPRWS